jgi:hypothetical protein
VRALQAALGLLAMGRWLEAKARLEEGLATMPDSEALWEVSGEEEGEEEEEDEDDDRRSMVA